MGNSTKFHIARLNEGQHAKSKYVQTKLPYRGGRADIGELIRPCVGARQEFWNIHIHSRKMTFEAVTARDMFGSRNYDCLLNGQSQYAPVSEGVMYGPCMVGTWLNDVPVGAPLYFEVDHQTNRIRVMPKGPHNLTPDPVGVMLAQPLHQINEDTTPYHLDEWTAADFGGYPWVHVDLREPRHIFTRIAPALGKYRIEAGDVSIELPVLETGAKLWVYNPRTTATVIATPGSTRLEGQNNIPPKEQVLVTYDGDAQLYRAVYMGKG